MTIHNKHPNAGKNKSKVTRPPERKDIIAFAVLVAAVAILCMVAFVRLVVFLSSNDSSSADNFDAGNIIIAREHIAHAKK